MYKINPVVVNTKNLINRVSETMRIVFMNKNFSKAQVRDLIKRLQFRLKQKNDSKPKTETSGPAEKPSNSPKRATGNVPMKKKTDFSVPSNILKEAENK